MLPTVNKHKDIPNKAKISIVDMLYYQPQGEQPEAIESRYCIDFTPQDEPYKRKKNVNETFVQVDTGYVVGQCLMVLINKGIGINSSNESRLAISFDHGHTTSSILFFRESMRVHLLDPTSVYIKALGNKDDDNKPIGCYQVHLFMTSKIEDK